jgi:short chain dehydrogenase
VWPREVERMVRDVVERLGGLGVLVNGAGYTEMILFPDLDAISEESGDRVMAVNVNGRFCARGRPPRACAERAARSSRPYAPPDVSQVFLSLLAGDGVARETVVIDGARAIRY